MMILKTSRLYLREICTGDRGAICSILQDIDVMYAWEHAFSDDEVTAWINENMMRYARDGYSYWAVIEQSTGRLIGISRGASNPCGFKASIHTHCGVALAPHMPYMRRSRALHCTQLDVLKLSDLTREKKRWIFSTDEGGI